MPCGYSLGVGADISLNANTVQTVLGIHVDSTECGICLKKVGLSARGSGSTAPTAIPVLIELGRCTFATNSPGTNSTAETVVQTYGLRITASGAFNGGSAWTSEPTVITVIDEFTMHIQQMMKEGLPFSEEPDAAPSEGFVLRITNPTGNPTVPFRPMFHFERI
jgi:hypothetical protein